MGHKNREIELKAWLKGASSLAPVERRLNYILASKARRTVRAKAEDVYFKAPRGARADFIRLRRKGLGSKAGTYTIKFTDRGGNLDRVEKDNHVDDFAQMLDTMKDVHGAPEGTVLKTYVVYWLGSKGDESDTTVSIYRVVNDHRVFIEIEGKSKQVVDYWTIYIASRVPYKLIREYRALYQIFVKGGKKMLRDQPSRAMLNK